MNRDGPPAKIPELPERLVRNVEEVRARIRDSARKASREPEEVTLVAVTKTVPAGIVDLLPALGLTDAAETRIKSAEEKLRRDAGGLKWHMIGHLQRNKARRALSIFSLVHSLDSARLLTHLDRLAAEGDRVVQALVQLNISGEEQKHGVDPEEARGFLGAANELEGVRIRGLMGMGRLVTDPEEVRPQFRTLREIRDEANRMGWYREPLVELSMGMTNDYEVAVEEGATMVRIGTALFTGVVIEEEVA